PGLKRKRPSRSLSEKSRILLAAWRLEEHEVLGDRDLILGQHWGMLFKAAVLSTLLSVGAEAGTSQNENNLVQAIRSGASNSISQTGQQIIQHQLNVQPTLTIRPGFPVRVIVTRDLILAPYGSPTEIVATGLDR